MIIFDNKPVTSQKTMRIYTGWLDIYLLVLEVKLEDALCGRISLDEQGGLRGLIDARLESVAREGEHTLSKLLRNPRSLFAL